MWDSRPRRLSGTRLAVAGAAGGLALVAGTGVAVTAVAHGSAAARAIATIGRLTDRTAPPPPTRSAGGRATAPAGRAGRVAAEVSGLQAQSIVVDGVTRDYLISVPAGLKGPAPLVLAFHGLFSTAGAFAAATGLVPATAAAGQVLVLPQSIGAGFNDGRFGHDGPHDDAFAVALIDRLVRRGLVDPERVTVAGFSDGAGMAMQIADAHPDRIAAVVSIDGEMIRGSLAPRPTGPVEAVLVHGTADAVQPWAGRGRRGPDEPPYISETRTVQAWVAVDACGRRTQRTLPGAVGPGAAGPVTIQTWAAGPSGAGVTFYRVAGMHHRWPVTTLEGRHRSDQLAAIDATRIIVATADGATREGRRTVVV